MHIYTSPVASPRFGTAHAAHEWTELTERDINDAGLSAETREKVGELLKDGKVLVYKVLPRNSQIHVALMERMSGRLTPVWVATKPDKSAKGGASLVDGTGTTFKDAIEMLVAEAGSGEFL